MSELPKTRKINYTLTDGTSRDAQIFPVEVNVNDLNDSELQVLGRLMNASHNITPIYAKQNHKDTLSIFKDLEQAEHNLSGKEREALENYNTLFSVRNSLWDGLNGLGFKLPLEDKVAEEVIPRQTLEALTTQTKAPKGRNLYPNDITEEEFEKLGSQKNIVNSIVERQRDGTLRVVTNEEKYKRELMPVIMSLNTAAILAKDAGLKNYLEAKMQELKTGSPAAREEAYKLWLGNNSKIDIVIGTGVEEYFDRFKGVRGMAQSGVFIERKDYTELCSQIISALPEFEARAPWKHKKKIDTAAIPKLRFFDVATMSGFYEFFPNVTRAECLPNEQEFRDKYGSVNLIFANIDEAMAKYGSAKVFRDEFFRKEDMSGIQELMGPVRLKTTALHEIGHASGGTVTSEDPRVIFGKDYSLLEECRAEVFSIWALPSCVEKGIIKKEDELAGYYSMATTLIRSMEIKPVDHSGSRNMMFHYFMKHNALLEVEQGGQKKYTINPTMMRLTTEKMLGELGDMRAEGDTAKFERFKAEYISTERQGEFKQRLQGLPLGSGIIFPELLIHGGKYTRELLYAPEFRQQSRALSRFT